MSEKSEQEAKKTRIPSPHAVFLTFFDAFSPLSWSLEQARHAPENQTPRTQCVACTAFPARRRRILCSLKAGQFS